MPWHNPRIAYIDPKTSIQAPRPEDVTNLLAQKPGTPIAPMAHRDAL
jgi:hypothetical protein